MTQLPESRRACETRKALADLRRTLPRRGHEPTKAVALKVPKPLFDWLTEQSTANGFDSRQGLVLSLIRRAKESADADR